MAMALDGALDAAIAVAVSLALAVQTRSIVATMATVAVTSASKLNIATMDMATMDVYHGHASIATTLSWPAARGLRPMAHCLRSMAHDSWPEAHSLWPHGLMAQGLKDQCSLPATIPCPATTPWRTGIQ